MASSIPHCPVCQRQAITIETKFGERCTCSFHRELWSWSRKPLVDKATHEARKIAHATFDAIWKEKLCSRSFAYKLLAEVLGIAPQDCHIALMDRAMAEQVPHAAETIRAFIAKVPPVVICERRSYPTRPTY